MSSRNRSSSALGIRDYIPGNQLAPRNISTADSRPTENPIRARSRSVSRNPTSRVPLSRAGEEDKTRRSSGTSGRLPATFESLTDPRSSTPDTPTPKPIKGILRNPSQSPATAIRPSSTLPTAHQSQYRPSALRSFNQRPQLSTPTRTLFANPAQSPVTQASTMSGRATVRGKARGATSTAGGAKKKPVHVNGTRSSKKAIESSDEGSSSSDEESSDSSSDSTSDSDEESTASERASKGPQKSAGAHVGTKKTNAAAAAASESSESESESSASEDATSKPKAKKPAVAAATANRGQKGSSSDEDSDSSSDSEAESGGSGVKVAPVREIPDSSTDSSEEEESEESEAEAQPGQKTRILAKSAGSKKAETPVSSSSEEDSDEEMDDAPPSGQTPFNSSKTSRAGILKASSGGAPVAAPSTMDGGFKLQKAQNLGQMAALLSEANAKGDRVWLLTHPSSTPLNLEVQHIFAAPEHHRNSIVPNGVKLTYPVSADGKNFHAISGCNSITVTQTARNDTDISSLTQVVSKSLMSAKEAPTQPAGLRSRYLPIGVGSRASPTLEDSPTAVLPRASKKENKKDKTSVEPSDERPSKKRKVAAEVGSSAAAQPKAKAQSSSQPIASSPAPEPDSEKPKKSSGKSKSKDLPPLMETPSKASRAKPKVKFAGDDVARSSTPVPLPQIPSSQIKDTPSSQLKDTPSSQAKSSSKKKRRLSNDGDAAPPSSEKKEKKKRAMPSSSWSRPEDVKVTPVAPPTIPGMR